MILIVDDEPASLLLLEMMLRPTNSVVRRATSGTQALAVLEEGEPCVLVITDIRMPGMDGRELVARMKADPRLAAIPVIMVTGVLDRDVVAEMFDQGVRDYIVKPYQAAVVMSRVRAALLDEISIIELRQRTVERLSIGDPEYTDLARETIPTLERTAGELLDALRTHNAERARAVAERIDEPAALFGGRRAILAAHRLLDADGEVETLHFGSTLVTEIGQLRAALERASTAA
jgi:CheY-like chemotaxis protein